LFLLSIFFNFFLLKSFLFKFTSFISLLLYLNKLKLNILILLIFSLLIIFSTKNQINLLFLLFITITWKWSKLYFIKLFFFGFFKSHLILLYISILIFFSSVNYTFKFLKLQKKMSLFLNICAFGLGGRWALFLYNWWYYWTNDAIEYVLLFFTTALLLFIHSLKLSTLIFNFIFLLSTYCLVLLRLNFIYTKHNFFQQSALSYHEIKMFLYMYTIQLILFKLLLNNKIYKKKLNPLCFLFFLFFFLTIYNKLNLFIWKNIIYFYFKLLTTFYIISSFRFNNLFLSILHWLVFVILIILYYLNLTHLINLTIHNKLSVISNNLVFNNPFYLIFKKLNFSYINTNTLKINNLFQLQSTSTLSVKKKIINLFY